MSGHPKWATTKHKKAVIDARRGKSFAKLIKNIEVAARTGGHVFIGCGLHLGPSGKNIFGRIAMAIHCCLHQRCPAVVILGLPGRRQQNNWPGSRVRTPLHTSAQLCRRCL